MGLVQAKIGGNFGYNLNIRFPLVAGNAGTAFATVSALATTFATVYPEPVAGNACLITNSASLTALAVYDGTIWVKA